MAMFGVEAILCAGVVVENGASVEFHDRVWMGARVKVGFWFLLCVQAGWALWLGEVCGLSSGWD